MCGTGDKIVLACSGASDVGCISDKVARSLQIAGKRKMSCLALVGAGIQKSIDNFKTKDLLVIDGCPIACGKRIVEKHDFANYKHVVITDYGFKKGETPVSDKTVMEVLSKVVEL
jgi:uncharacterized metal-binding protein